MKPAKILNRLGPGLVTGAADDDPSGIATYSQAGAQFGPTLLWTMLFTYPLMVSVQLASAQVGRVTGRGLADNLKAIMPKWLVIGLVVLLFAANTINVGADLAAMGEASALVAGGGKHYFTLGFALLSLGLQLFVPYRRYASFLKWLTLVLFSYIALLFMIRIDWSVALHGLVIPTIAGAGAITTVVAIFGTTISPYLFFWQASQEVEEVELSEKREPLKEKPGQGKDALSRLRWDTFSGMALSNIVALAIMLGTAATLHAAGKTDIGNAADAASALRPVAGDLAFAVFSLGIVGTGLLAVPVLTGASAYAICGIGGWTASLEYKLRRARCVLRGDFAGHGARAWNRLVADQPDQGVVLERGDQRRGCRADPGRADDRGWPPQHHGRVRGVAGTRIFGWLTVAVMGIAAVAMIALPG